MKGIVLAVVMGLCFFSLVFMIRIHTHQNQSTANMNKEQEINKALDDAQTKIDKSPVIDADCYPKEAFNIVAVDASKHTVDFIVNKMITEKFIIVSKDGMSYRFKLVNKFKTKAVKK